MIKLIFAGGFLGAGKTTLIKEAAIKLTAMGKQVGLITNDQADDLVDTKILGKGNINIAEVTGSCFCCDFKALRRAMDKVSKDKNVDVIIAEPVGSCTDLSATLINPIRDMMKTEVSVAPLTVLVDPERLKSLLSDSSDIHPSAAYIIKKQLEESDIIAITKTDLHTHEEINMILTMVKKAFPECDVITLSSMNGTDVANWIEKVINSEDSGKHIIELDYDKYAEGEAVLGWLNCSASLTGNNVDWDLFTRRFMTEFALKFDKNNNVVGHVKAIVERGDRYIVANLTGSSKTLNFRWSAGTGDSADLVVNARVEMSPAELEKTFIDTLNLNTNGEISVRMNRLRCISPGYPNPTFRYSTRV
jgi:G3E family GTPase